MSVSLSPSIIALCVGLGAIASVAGGIVGGVVVGGKVLGNQLAALLGAFYGPLAGVGGCVLGLLVLLVAG